ncbi:MAG: hypothetical protein Q9170_001951 [Blastenia crenularia]
MSPTNIHYASALLDRAGSKIDVQATIQPFGIGVYEIYTPAFSQEAIDKYAELLNHGVEGQWLSNASDPTRLFRVVDPSPPAGIPKVCISRALEDSSRSGRYGKSETSQQPTEPLHYLLIVQGKNASERSKVVVERSLHEVATSMLHEAMNGYSVVFTGALRRSDMNKLFSRKKTTNFSFKIMPDVATLTFSATSRDFQATEQLGIIC